ncbi:hypothetical protein E3N88_45609 [Mikania micrantha]|uniref:Uncharacterized protein n=1 Tax=Mikania micrantha TaxID=192012 RepID=A0A5N6L8S0_9ASTR|nr:hypothetical protein E3N88_45609 [Mikania micrantha]
MCSSSIPPVIPVIPCAALPIEIRVNMKNEDTYGSRRNHRSFTSNLEFSPIHLIIVVHTVKRRTAANIYGFRIMEVDDMLQPPIKNALLDRSIPAASNPLIFAQTAPSRF